MKNFSLRKIIRRTLLEQEGTGLAHPMDLERIYDTMGTELEQNWTKNKWRKFKGAIQHLVTGEPNANCGCNSFMPGGDPDNPGGGGGY